MSKSIKLNSRKHLGYETIVDDEDYEILSQYKWHPEINPKSENVYVSGWINNKNIRMHRFVMKLHGNEIDDFHIDHKDRNGLNNQKENLRPCSHTENQHNTKKKKNGITSVYKGVYFKVDRNKFRAHIKDNGKDIHIGYYQDEIDAAIAYNKQAIKLYGEFANLNII